MSISGIITIVGKLLSVICFAVLGWLRYKKETSERVDSVVIGLFAAACVILLIPVERITNFKGLGFEYEIGGPQVEAAINSQSSAIVSNQQVREAIEDLGDKLRFVEGSRILWIDNVPSSIVAYRRLIRALGADIIPAHTGDRATEILDSDQDFDLIISDTKWCPEDELPECANRYYAVDFIVNLRKSDRTIVRELPVVFMSSLDSEELREVISPATALSVGRTSFANTPADLISEVVRMLAIQRSKIVNYEDQALN